MHSKIQAQLGGRMRFLVCGSAPLSPEVARFLRVCFGCPLAEGYGLTESAAAAAAVRADTTIFGDVGQVGWMPIWPPLLPPCPMLPARRLPIGTLPGGGGQPPVVGERTAIRKFPWLCTGFFTTFVRKTEPPKARTTRTTTARTENTESTTDEMHPSLIVRTASLYPGHSKPAMAGVALAYVVNNRTSHGRGSHEGSGTMRAITARRMTGGPPKGEMSHTT